MNSSGSNRPSQMPSAPLRRAGLIMRLTAIGVVLALPGRVPIIGRFALAGGQPYVSDAPQTVRSMAILFKLPNGEEWRTGMNNIPVFVVNTAQGFYDQLLASASDPATGKPDPAAMNAFLAKHPESARAIRLIRSHPVSSGFANSTYNSLNAFRFISVQGAVVPVRWSMVPVQPFEQSHARHQFRSAGAAERNCSIGRSAAERSIGGVFAVVHPARRRAQGPQRGFGCRNRKISIATTNNPTQFALLSRILHWLMAAMLLTMLFIGVSMISSLGNYHRLVAIHRPLGIMILILAAIRLANRMFTTLPPFPPTMSRPERFIATASERLLYTLMFALPLVGWGMLSAGPYPIVMYASRVSPVHDLSRPPWRGAVPHADSS